MLLFIPLFSTVLFIIPDDVKFYFLFSALSVLSLKTYRTVQSHIQSINTIICLMIRNSGAMTRTWVKNHRWRKHEWYPMFEGVWDRWMLLWNKEVTWAVTTKTEIDRSYHFHCTVKKVYNIILRHKCFPSTNSYKNCMA